MSGFAWLFTGSCKADKRDEITAYVKKTFEPLPGGVRTVKQAIEVDGHLHREAQGRRRRGPGVVVGVAHPEADACEGLTCESPYEGAEEEVIEPCCAGLAPQRGGLDATRFALRGI